MTIEMAASGAVVSLRVAAAGDLWRPLTSALRSLTGDVRAIVLHLAPDGEAAASDRSAWAHDQAAREKQWALDRLDSPDLLSIGVLAGPTSGPSVAAALGCDLRVWHEGASLAVPDGSAVGCLGQLADVIGYSRALEICLTGRRVAAPEAEQVGLANLVTSGDRIDDAVDDLVAALLSTPRAAATELKGLLSASGLDRAARRRRREAEFAASARVASDDE